MSKQVELLFDKTCFRLIIRPQIKYLATVETCIIKGKKIGTILLVLLLLFTVIKSEEIPDYEYTRISRKRDFK